MQHTIATQHNIKKAAALLVCLLMAGVLTGCKSAPKELPKTEMSLMERYHSGKDLIHDEDNTVVDSKLTRKQQEARAHLTRGHAFEEQDRPELAFEQYSRAAKLDPSLTQARYQRGRQLLNRGLSMQAMKEFSVVTQQQPEYAPGHLALGRVYFRNGLYAEAEQHILTALSHNPKLANAYEMLGIIRNHNRHYTDALQAFTAALAIAPDTARIYNNMGLTLSMAGRDAEAVEAFRTAIRKGETSPRTYNNLALSLCRLGKTGEAVEAFTAASDEATAWNNLGYFLFLDGKHALAVSAFRRAIELKPKFYVRAAENLKRARLAARFSNTAGASDASATLPVQPQLSSFSTMPIASIPAPAPMAAFLPATTKAAVAPAAVQSESNITQSTPKVVASVLTSSKVKTPTSTVKHSESSIKSLPHRPASLRERTISEPPAFTSPLAPITDEQTAKELRKTNEQLRNNTTRQQVKTQEAQTTVPPMPTKASPSKSMGAYTLHHSSFRSAMRAEAVAKELKTLGFEAKVTVVTIPEKGEWNRVSIGSFALPADARAFRNDLIARKPDFESLRIVRNALFARGTQAHSAQKSTKHGALQVASAPKASQPNQTIQGR